MALRDQNLNNSTIKIESASTSPNLSISANEVASKMDESRYGHTGIVVSPTNPSNDEMSSQEEDIENREIKKRQAEPMVPARRSRPVYVSFEFRMGRKKRF